MTDKELDEKLAAAFDNVRADSAVKARIRKGLTGDIMDNNKTITVSKTADKDERAGTIKVNRRGRIAAAVIAGVLAVGGGSYLLKNGFARVAPGTDSHTEQTTDDDAYYYNGEKVDKLPMTNEKLGFHPEAEQIYDKFGYNPYIWTLANGNYLVGVSFDENGNEYESGDYCRCCFYIYDPETNSVKSVLTDLDDPYSYTKSFVQYGANWNRIVFTQREQRTDMTCKVYDLNLAPVEECSFEFDTEYTASKIMVTSDNKAYLVAYKYTDYGTELYLYDSKSNVVYKSEQCDSITPNTISISTNGKYFYYGTSNGDSMTLHAVALADGYVDAEHTDSIYNNTKYPYYFDSGRYLYTVFLNDKGEQRYRRIDMTGKEELVFGKPEDDMIYDYTFADSTYITRDGKYLFNSHNDENDNILCVYDIENEMKKVYETKIGTIRLDRDGIGILYDEATGDVCLCKPFAEDGGPVCLNLTGKEYSNFGMPKSVQNDTADTSDTHYYNGEAVDELPVSNEELGFDPEAEKIEDKFGSESALWKLSNGNFLVGKPFNKQADEFGITEYLNSYLYVYEPDTNSVKSVLINDTKKLRSVQVEENCILNVKCKENAKTDTEYTYEFYDLDLVPIENSTFSFDAGLTEPKVLITPDNESYIVGQDFSIYDSKGNVIHKSKNSGFVFPDKKISNNGKCIYYASSNENSVTLHTVSLDDGYAYNEYTYETNKDFDIPLYFDSGKYLYIVYSGKDGKQQFGRIDMTGEEEPVDGKPKDELVFDDIVGDSNGDQYNIYLTKDGKYLFLSSDGDSGSVLNVYDIENEFKKVYETKIDNRAIRRDGMNVLYDENTGDVCLDNAHNKCFNLFGNEYSNFNLKTNVKDTTEANENDTSSNATIPDVIGNEAEDAERKLTEAGFKPVLRSAYDDAPEGQVVRIEPAAGTEAPLGSTVMIYVYKYAEYKNDLTFNLSIPKGLRGSFSVVVHSDDYYYGGGIYDFNGEDVESNAIPIYLSSNKDTDVFTITLNNCDTGKSVEYYKVEADFRTGELKAISDYDTDGLLAISSQN